MSRAVTLGNGNLLVGLDHLGQVRDFYFPYAGHANHVSGASGSYTHRIGVWVDGMLRWVGHPSWRVTLCARAGSVENFFTAVNTELGITLTLTQSVHNEHNIFVRNVTVTNERDAEREVRVFFGQEFRIAESRRGDTAFYDPRVHSIVHYKGHEAFLIHATVNGNAFDDYSVGIFGIEGKEGTYTDAEDGLLSKNAIEHGSVDSVIGLTTNIDAHSDAHVCYWITAGKTIREVHDLHERVSEETTDRLLDSTWDYWNAWVEGAASNLSPLDAELTHLYKQSLLTIRTHMDNRGGIIASSDSDMLNQGRDTYSYVWPRDAALSAYALDRAGYDTTTSRFFTFMAPLFERDGYLMHKYRVDGVLGSSWHPWVRNGNVELPIQEDETALVIYMLGKHYERSKDLELVESLYNTCIEPAANFMTAYIDGVTGLPQGSYDLWEEKYGTSTYTAAAVFGALNAAAQMSALLGKRTNARAYSERAEGVREGILGYLYDAEHGVFPKLLRHEPERFTHDATVDMSSFHGIVFFNVLQAADPRVTRAYEAVRARLQVLGQHGGYMRYENDGYYRREGQPPNAWCITTLWEAQYLIKRAQTRAELKPAYAILRHVYAHASSGSILPEQIDPQTGEHRSASPLVWSHSEFVITIHDYLEKYRALH